MKVFIVQLMKDREDLEISIEREKIKKKVEEIYPNEAIDIGKSLLLLSEADLVVFANGYQNGRGCRIEEQVAYTYGINRLYL